MTPDQLAPINTVLQAISAAGIFVAAWQLGITKRQAITTFEDKIAREYRDLTNRLPTYALLGKELTEEKQQAAFDEFYHYFDLSNEQVFLRQRGRIRLRTWVFWRDGIRSNLRRPAFQRAWEEISQLSNGDFAELRQLMAGNFEGDPRRWKPNRRQPPPEPRQSNPEPEAGS